MKTNKDFLKEYRSAYNAMRERAIEVIKGYGKVLEVHEVIKARVLKAHGFNKMPEVGTAEFDALSEEYDERKWSDVYSCVIEGKHEQVYITNIIMVRYNKERDCVEAYLESDDGYVSEWMPVAYVSFDSDAVYKTILEFTDDEAENN